MLPVRFRLRIRLFTYYFPRRLSRKETQIKKDFLPEYLSQSEILN